MTNAKIVENDSSKQRERCLVKRESSIMILNYKYLKKLSFEYNVTTFV